jgi:acetyltransferase
MISRTRVFNLLMGFRDRPPANIDAICLTLIQVAQLIIDFPEIVGIDINPLFADADGVLAVDACIEVASAKTQGSEHLAIRPYPKRLEESVTLRDGRTVLLRPIRPEDEPDHQVFLSRLSQEDIRYRFFHVFRQLPHSEMARLTQIDYDREMAFIATAPDEHGKPETLGVVRTITDPDNESTEFAVIARSDQKGQGLGHILMEKIIRYCQSRETQCMIGQVLRDNRPMLKLADRLGFSREYDRDEGVYDLKLNLQNRELSGS